MMDKKILRAVIGLVIAGILSPAAFASTKNSIKNVDKIIKTQTGVETDLTRNIPDADVQEEIRKILSDPLIVDGAVKIALLNNPSVKADLAQLGISQADMIQAGLLHNPKFSGFMRKSNQEGRNTNTEFEVKQDVMDLLFWPLRKRLANTQFRQAEYDLAKTILDFIKEVRLNFYTWQASEHMLAMRRDHFKAEEAALELAQRQKAAGNINILELEQQKGIYYQVKTDLQRSELEANMAAQILRNLLGLTKSELEWISRESLPDLSSDNFSLNDLEEKAMANRIDLAVKRQEMKGLEQSLTMAQLDVIPSVEGGYHWEKETDGNKIKGPVFEADVPVFDRKQADRLRAHSRIESGRKQLEALEAQIRLEVRLAYEQLTADRAMTETYREAIPVRQEILKQTLYHYNYMLKGVYDLLRAKQEEINAQHDYIVALRDYWMARSELEHAIGVSLPVERPNVKNIEKPREPVMEHEHHHHGGMK